MHLNYMENEQMYKALTTKFSNDEDESGSDEDNEGAG